MKTILLSLVVVALLAVALAPGFFADVAHRANDKLFGYMARSGLVLGAEVLGRLPSEVAAGRKVLPDTEGKASTAVFELPLTHAAYQIADTIGSGIVLKKGARLLCPVTLSFSTGTASCTLAVGLRNPVTKAAIDATAIMAATAITTAGTSQVNTGTKLTGGQRYVLDQDAEIYGTVAGAVLAVDQAVRVEVPFIQA